MTEDVGHKSVSPSVINDNNTGTICNSGQVIIPQIVAMETMGIP